MNPLYNPTSRGFDHCSTLKLKTHAIHGFACINLSLFILSLILAAASVDQKVEFTDMSESSKDTGCSAMFSKAFSLIKSCP